MVNEETQAIRAELHELATALLRILAEVVTSEPILAEHLRVAARFTRNAVTELDASAGGRLVDGSIDLRGGEASAGTPTPSTTESS